MREDYTNPELEKRNLNEFNKLMDLKEFEEKGIEGHRRYYQDHYGNRYYWYVERQADRKFYGKINNVRSRRFTAKIKRTKKKMVISWLLKKFYAANARWDIAEKKRKERQAIRDEAKPKFTAKEIQRNKVQEKINRLLCNIKKNDTKIKTCQTRIKTSKRKIKYHQRRLDKLGV